MVPSDGSLTQELEITEQAQSAFCGVRVPPREPSRLFGGYLIAQSLLAACAGAMSDRQIRSSCTNFVRAGDSQARVEHQVRDVDSGRSFGIRTVDSVQEERQLAHTCVTFAAAPAGSVAHPDPDPVSVDPEVFLSLAELTARNPADWAPLYLSWRHLDVRYEVPPVDRPGLPVAERTRARVWLRARETQPDDPRWHASVLAYVSDLTLLSVALPIRGLCPRQPGMRMASLSHAVWFHRQRRVDEGWLRYDQALVALSSDVALVRGSLFAEDGTLIASVAQEGLIRLPDPPIDPGLRVCQALDNHDDSSLSEASHDSDTRISAG
jgi:acyl-CoA thioesterase-2